MKKTLFIIAACALAAVSCQKESAVENEIKSEGIITVTADIAQFGGDTKTSFNGSADNPKPLWSAGDEIKLFNTEGNAAIYALKSGEEGKSSATFKLKSGQTALSGTFACAYYPAANATAYTDGTGITATIPATQAYTAANSGDSGKNAGTFAPGAAPMVGTGTFNSETGNLGLTFKNVFGILQLNFTGTETIKQIDVIGTANLSGTATITTGDTPSCSFSSGQRYVTLTSVNQTLDESTSKAFYIAVPVGTLSKIYITTETNLQSVTKSIEITRSTITSKNSATLSAVGFSAVTYSEASTLTPAIICGTVWAPVNCGYDATSYPYGRLYQWGRKYGQGYDSSDGDYPGKSGGSQSSVDIFESGSLTSYPDGDTYNGKFYYGQSNWYSGSSPAADDLWGATKTSYDPCPSGWRVPTFDELNALRVYKSSWTTNNGQNGYWFSGGITYSKSVSRVFLPAAGYLNGGNGYALYRGGSGVYWSSSVKGDFAGLMTFYNSGADVSNTHRAYGHSVRCVQE